MATGAPRRLVDVLTVLHPEFKPLIKQFPGGLLPLQFDADEPFSLVIKTQKDAILAAKLNNGLSFYLPVLQAKTIATTALISAFFDDADEPLIIRTPLLYDDDDCYALLEILGYDEVDIYFFDEHDYEWMSFRATLENGGSWLRGNDEVHLPPYHPETVKSIYQFMSHWFSSRTPDDDKRAIKVVFKKELSVNDLVVLDMTPAANHYHGSTGFRDDRLIRTEPGYFQERDISACLLRAFSPESIMMNPLRQDTSKEVLDHLVLTDTVAIFIQAKDSPNTAAGISRTLARKRRATRQQIDDAIRQINGAARFFSREPVATLVVGGECIDISIGERRVIGLAIVKELFDDEGGAYENACSKLARLSGGGIVMDYSSFHAFTHHFRSAQSFIEALDAIILRMKTEGWFPVKAAVFDEVLDWLERPSEQESP